MKMRCKTNKNLIYITMLVFPIVFLLSLKMAYSLPSMGGFAIDSTLKAFSVYTEEYYRIFASVVDSFMNNSFAPDFATILELEERVDIAGINPSETMYTKEMVKNTYLFGVLFPNIQKLAAALATGLMFFGLILCIAGRSEQIRDTPLRIMSSYVVAILMDYIAFDIIYELMDAVRTVWISFIFGTSDSALFSELAAEVGTITEKECTILGITINLPENIHLGALACGGPIITFLLFWKLLKQFLKLYLEVAERYFVLIVLLLFYPVAFATTVNGNSKNIFASYLRMFLSQAFIMMANLMFMKFFIYVGHGWLRGFINYIAALAYLQVCQRIDSYMLAMGLNVAQTGSGLFSSIRGAGLGLMSAVRGLSNINSARKNLGNTIAAVGASKNNFDLYKMGTNIGASAKTAGNVVNPVQSFEQTMNNIRKPSQGMHTFKAGTLDTEMKKLSIPSTQKEMLQNAGISPSSITGIETNSKTGAVTYSDAKGRVGTYYNGKMLTNNSRDAELKYFEKRSAIVNNSSSPAVAKKNMVDQLGGMANRNVQALSQRTLIDKYGTSRGYENCKITKGPESSTSVGSSSATITGSYVKEGERKSASTTVDMFNVAQYPETLENQSKEGWNYIEEDGQGFMVHEHSNTFANDLNESSKQKQFASSDSRSIDDLRQNTENEYTEKQLKKSKAEAEEISLRNRYNSEYTPSAEVQRKYMEMDKEIGEVLRQNQSAMISATQNDRRSENSNNSYVSGLNEDTHNDKKTEKDKKSFHRDNVETGNVIPETGNVIPNEKKRPINENNQQKSISNTDFQVDMEENENRYRYDNNQLTPEEQQYYMDLDREIGEATKRMNQE